MQNNIVNKTLNYARELKYPARKFWYKIETSDLILDVLRRNFLYISTSSPELF